MDNDDIERKTIARLNSILSKPDIDYLRSLTNSSNNTVSTNETHMRMFEASVWCLGGTVFYLISEPIVAIILFLVSVGLVLSSLNKVGRGEGVAAISWSFLILTIISCIYITPLLEITNIIIMVAVGMLSAVLELAFIFCLLMFMHIIVD